MERRSCIVLHKSKWEQLKKQASQDKSHDEDVNQFHNKREYYKALDEQSKEWKKKWPDTLEGCLAKVEARKERQREKDLAFVKVFEEKQRSKASGHDKAIAEAKKKIFYTSNYGQQIISAVRESKVIEERKAQIEFKKFMKQKAKEVDETTEAQIASMKHNLYDLARNEAVTVEKRKEAVKEQARINKLMHEYNEYQTAKAKEQEILGELEDERHQKMNLKYEEHEMDHCKEKAVQESKQYAADQIAFKEGKMQRAREDDALIQVWAEHHERVRCKKRLVLEKIIKGRGESENYKRAYEMAERAQENEKKSYERFVDTGIKKFEKRQNKIEENSKEKQQKYEDYRKQAVEDYKNALEVNTILKHCNKCSCDKQSLFTKPCVRTLKKIIGSDESDKYKPESFLAPCTKLSDELCRRQREPTPWSGLSAEHAYFAEQAATTVRECQHKHMARRVVRDYKKSYYLDSTTLPVPDCQIF